LDKSNVHTDHSILLSLESVHEIYESGREVLALDVGQNDYIVGVIVFRGVESKVVEVVHDPGGHLLGTGLESIDSLGVLSSDVLQKLFHVALQVFRVGRTIEGGFLVAESIEDVQDLLGLFSSCISLSIGIAEGVSAANINIVLSLNHVVGFDFGSDFIIDIVELVRVRDDLVAAVEHVKVENHLLIIEATTISTHINCEISTTTSIRSFGLIYFQQYNLINCNSLLC
jgi:hypothetical protein